MVFAIVTLSEGESMTFANHLLSKTGQRPTHVSSDYIETRNYVFLCMTADRVEFQSHGMVADLVWLSHDAFETIQDDDRKTGAVFDMSRFGGTTIIVNESEPCQD